MSGGINLSLQISLTVDSFVLRIWSESNWRHQNISPLDPELNNHTPLVRVNKVLIIVQLLGKLAQHSLYES